MWRYRKLWLAGRRRSKAMALTAKLNQKAKAILIRELGPVDYARFIQQYEGGSGDYTRDRQPI